MEGLKGPYYEKRNRLFYTLKFYDDKNQIYIQEKIFFPTENMKFENFV